MGTHLLKRTRISNKRNFYESVANAFGPSWLMDVAEAHERGGAGGVAADNSRVHKILTNRVNKKSSRRAIRIRWHDSGRVTGRTS